MKTILNFKVIVLMAMVSLFALNASAQNADEAKVLFSVKLDCKSCVKKVENHFGPMRGEIGRASCRERVYVMV